VVYWSKSLELLLQHLPPLLKGMMPTAEQAVLPSTMLFPQACVTARR